MSMQIIYNLALFKIDYLCYYLTLVSLLVFPSSPLHSYPEKKQAATQL